MAKGVRHKRVISQLKKFSSKSDFWVLINYGEIYYKKSDQLYYREADFVGTNCNSYDLNEWDRNNVRRIELLETKTLLFCLGTIFNNIGHPIREPKINDKFLKVYNIVISNLEESFEHNYLENIYSDTDYPFYSVNSQIPIDKKGGKSARKIFYHKRVFVNKKINSLTDEYIIPNDLLRKYFYYRSFAGINSIVKNKLVNGILHKKHIDGEWVVAYNSDFIKKFDVAFLSKYYFTNEPASKPISGLERLKDQVRKFRLELAHNHPDAENEVVGTLNFPVPFSFRIKIEVLGQCITDHELSEQKYITYKILSFKKYENQKSNKIDLTLFDVERFSAIDIKDKSSTDKREEKESINSGAKIIPGHENIQHEYENDGKTTNPYLDTLITNILDDSNADDFDIDINFIKRDDQKNAYYRDRFIKLDVSGLSGNLDHTDSFSNLEKEDVRKVKVKSYECIMAAMEILAKDNVLLHYQFVTINNSTDSLYSQIHANNDSNTTMQDFSKILIIKVIYNETEFCIIESGAGKYIGIFENLGFPISDQNDENLTNFLDYVIKEYDYMWSSFFADKNLKIKNTDANTDILKHIADKTKKNDNLRKMFHYKILRPIYHKSTIKTSTTIEEDLASRIFKRLK